MLKPGIGRRLLPPVLVVTVLTGCGRPFPADVEGTLEQIRTQGVLRAGASHHPPFVVHPGEPGGDPTGTEVDLVTAYAAGHGATVEWTVTTETVLMERLGNGELDLVVAGLRADSPWGADAGLTRVYDRRPTPGGRIAELVMATPAGENALLTDLERWLDTHGGPNR